MFEYFFESVKDRALQLKILAIMTDDNKAVWPGFKRVFWTRRMLFLELMALTPCLEEESAWFCEKLAACPTNLGQFSTLGKRKE